MSENDSRIKCLEARIEKLETETRELHDFKTKYQSRSLFIQTCLRMLGPVLVVAGIFIEILLKKASLK